MSIRATWLHGTRLCTLPVCTFPVLACIACAARPIPDPRAVAQRWAEAVRANDEEAVYALLTESAQRAQGRQGVKGALSEYHEEIAALAAETVSPTSRLTMAADVAYPGDRSARVVVEDGRYRIAAVSALPAAAGTPRDALRELREVLARRSFAGLLRVLTRDTGQSLETSIVDLVEALDEPSTLEIDLEGRRATAHLPGGHIVKLEREDGVWRVKDFD
jgi:hypothetical protein